MASSQPLAELGGSAQAVATLFYYVEVVPLLPEGVAPVPGSSHIRRSISNNGGSSDTAVVILPSVLFTFPRLMRGSTFIRIASTPASPHLTKRQTTRKIRRHGTRRLTPPIKSFSAWTRRRARRSSDHQKQQALASIPRSRSIRPSSTRRTTKSSTARASVPHHRQRPCPSPPRSRSSARRSPASAQCGGASVRAISPAK